MTRKRKRVLAIAICVCLSLTLCVYLICREDKIHHNYDEKWILGKTSQEVEARYGKFHITSGSKSADGLYRRGLGCYILKEKEGDFPGARPETLFQIAFNGDGIAYETFVDLGGWGG